MKMTCLLTLLLTFAACGAEAPGSADAEADPGALTASDDRERLSAAQLASRLPGRVATFRLRPDYARLRDSPGPRATSGVSVDYRDGDRQINVSVDDLIDMPEYVPRHRERLQNEQTEVETGNYTTRYASVESMEDGGVLTWQAEGEDGSVAIQALVTDRFLVQTSAGRGVTLAELRTFWDGMGFADLVGAPVYADAGPDAPPAWVSAIRGDDTDEPVSDPGPETPTGPVLATLPSCDVLLPVAEVERACGIAGVRAVATAFEREGENCNRKYVVGEGPTSGLLLIVSHFESARPAQGALRVATPDTYERGFARLSDLADGGYRGLAGGEGSPETYTVAFASGNVFVEVKGGPDPFDPPAQRICTDPGQGEAVARSIAERLAD